MRLIDPPPSATFDRPRGAHGAVIRGRRFACAACGLRSAGEDAADAAIRVPYTRLCGFSIICW
jgi:hypothetical protein